MKIKLIILFLFAFGTVALFTFKNKNRNKPKPVDTIIVDRQYGSEEERHLKKKEWIENMHRTAPGENWRAIDYKTRTKKYSQVNTKSASVSIAGGLLVGHWHEIGSDNLAGRTHLIEYDVANDSIYCASSGGNIWKADLNGNGWRSLHDNFKIDDIKILNKIDNGGSPRLLVASGQWGADNFYYSDDDGATWTASTGLSGISSWGTLVRAVVCNNTNKTIYILAMEWDYINWNKVTTLYVSNNKGVSFSEIASYGEPSYGSEENFDIWTDRYGSGTVYLLENNNISYLDASNNPVLISQINYSTTGNVLLAGCEYGANTYLYVGVYANDNIDFYQSTDAGISWTQKGNVPSNPFMKNSFTCSSTNPLNLYYGGIECYRSHNAGQNWTKINNWGDYYSNMSGKLHADIPSVNSFRDINGDEILFINTDGGTYTSNDSLLTVQNISLSNLNVSQYYSTYTHRTNTNHIFLGSQDQGYQKSSFVDTSTTVNFVQILSGDYGHIVSSNGGNSIWMVYPGFADYYPAAITSPYNDSWWDFICTGQHWIPPLMEDPVSPNKVYLGGGGTSGGAHIFHLEYTGGSINHTELPYDFGGTGEEPISAMAYSPINTDYRYVINNAGEFFVSTDGGTNWTKTNGFNGPGGNYLYGSSIVASPTTLGKVYVGGSGYSSPPAFVSNNNGQTFTAISTDIPNTMIYEMVSDPNDNFLFAATEVGPYVFVVSENKWFDLSLGNAPDQTYWTVDYIPSIKTVRFGTYGRGVWDFRIDYATENDILQSNSIEMNIYPNPTNGIVILSNNELFIKNVIIYDVYGKEVLKKVVGSNKCIIDISNQAKGIYLIKASTEKGFVINKVVLE